ncbi:MAG TPA: thioredoxin domain-containing protein, partial [Pirellulales bacterium]
MLVFFTADWCSYCEELVEESFRHPAVATLSQRFVCTLIDADVEKDVCQRFGVASYPTIQFLSPAGVPLNRMTGKKAPRQVAIEMQTALQAVARRLNSPVESLTR